MAKTKRFSDSILRDDKSNKIIKKVNPPTEASASVAAAAVAAVAGKTVPSTFLFFKTRKRKFKF